MNPHYDHVVFEHLVIERRGPVGWLINNRPDIGSAMNNTMRDELADALEALDADPVVRVIVHTGNGRDFHACLQETETASNDIGMKPDRQSTDDADTDVWHRPVRKPVITAVNGICSGAGLQWVANADIVIAASDARFFDPRVSYGQGVSVAAIALMKKMPVEAVMRMALLGRYEQLGAERALQIGMISEIVDPPTRLRDRAQELGETIAKNSPSAMAATKKAMWGALEMGLTDACRAGARHLVSMWGHPDQIEGPAAFAEKREPRWAELTSDTTSTDTTGRDQSGSDTTGRDQSGSPR
jgi:enoyl-CoA hydratase